MKIEQILILGTGLVLGSLITFGAFVLDGKLEIQNNLIKTYSEPSSCTYIKSNGIDDKINEEMYYDCQDYLENHSMRLVRMNEEYQIVTWDKFQELKDDCDVWNSYFRFTDGVINIEEYCPPKYDQSQTEVYAFTHAVNDNVFFVFFPNDDFSQQSEFFYGNYDQLVAKYNVVGLRLL